MQSKSYSNESEGAIYFALPANSEDAGMLYQWNRRIGWSSTNPMINSNGGTNWDSSNATGTTWEKANDPCPTGWRVPTLSELRSLADSDSYWGELNGVSGRFLGSEAQTLFLPAAGLRNSDSGTLYHVGTRGFYWSSNANTTAANYLSFTSASTSQGNDVRRYGFSVRCVAE